MASKRSKRSTIKVIAILWILLSSILSIGIFFVRSGVFAADVIIHEEYLVEGDNYNIILEPYHIENDGSTQILIDESMFLVGNHKSVRLGNMKLRPDLSWRTDAYTGKRVSILFITVWEYREISDDKLRFFINICDWLYDYLPSAGDSTYIFLSMFSPFDPNTLIFIRDIFDILSPIAIKFLNP